MRLIRNVRYSRVAILAGIMILGLMGFLFWSSAPGPGMSGGGLAESPHLSQQRQQPPAKSGPSRTTGDADVLPPVVGRPGEVVNRKGLVPKPTPHRPYDPSLQPGVPLGAWSKYLEDPYYHLPVRSIPDTRPRGCPRDDAVFAWADHPEADLKGVPSVSVIICFRNESATMLSATVATVLERTPVALLDRIVLVDDNGPETGFRDVPIGDATPEQLELMDLFRELEKNPRIVVHTNPESEGLIRARVQGANLAADESEILVFLDSHCEAGFRWLETLIEPIMTDPTMVTIPAIDLINDITLDFKASGGPFRGGFTNRLDYTWIGLTPAQEKRDREQPGGHHLILTPAMPGGLFAIHRDFWNHIGTYDTDMHVWGGENIEMSLRIWQCGGRMAFVPCSRVGHMFRTSFKQFKENFPYAFPDGASKTVGRNKARAAEVWIDSPDAKAIAYQHMFGRRDGTVPPHIEVGDLTERFELRRRLNCRSYDWYARNIYPDHPLTE